MVEFFFVETIRMSTQTKEWVDILKRHGYTIFIYCK